ncbi:MAG: hypothetical protein ACHQK8_06605, partial [Bacteroidia bacterium]
MKSFLKNKLPLILCYLVAIAFSLKNVREPDLWWQIKTGEWILEHKQVPKEDVFSYTFEGKPWINIKWGSEVLFASVTKVAGPESVFIIQIIVSCLLVYLLYLLCLHFSEWFKIDHPEKNSLLVFSLLLFIFGIEYRIIGRPEMFSHFFTTLFLLLLFRHQKLKDNEIFWLVPLQMIWANMHEAFGTGMVLMIIFSVTEWFDWYLQRQKKAKPVLLSIATVLSIAAVCVNPNGIELVTRPFNIFGQVFENKFTTELMDYTSVLFWEKEAYLGIILLFISIIGIAIYFFSNRKKNEKPVSFITQNNLTVLILLLVVFGYLASTAYRNIVFFLIYATPLFYIGLMMIIQKVKYFKNFVLFKNIFLFNIFLAVVLYTTVVSGKYYKWFERNDRYGLEIVSNINPSGAADFISENKLKGNAFCDYLSSSYLLWKLYPKFRSFIDLRDLDVFDNEFFSQFAEAVNDGNEFKKLDSTYHFSYAVVLANPQFSRLINYLYRDSSWSMVFVDAVATVFKKQTIKTNTDSLSITKEQPQSKLAFAISKLFNPFYQKYNYNEIDNDLLAASFYNMVGKMDLVKMFAQRSAMNSKEKYQAHELLGSIYFNLASNDTSKQSQIMLMDSAINYLQTSLKENADYSPVYMDLGSVAFRQQNYK